MVAGADGYQAVQLTRKHQPAVILLDITLPAANGFVVHDRLKNMSSLSTVPFVYISADRNAEPRAIAAGGVRFLAKPLGKERVLSTLRGVCQSLA
jgi:CheY-like chemotaxis protein